MTRPLHELHVAVLMGGLSSEREVSLSSGKECADALEGQVARVSRIDEITSRREQTQPIREKTGGSTFKNPPGHSSWKLVDEAGWRGKLFRATGGGAMFSELHSNFMINPGEATAADIEGLGETVRADVKSKLGVNLEWEIKRIGRAA